jgi:excisionase family DNA binding protein
MVRSGQFMDIKEVQEFLGVARGTIYKYIKQGKLTLHHSGVGNRAMFSRSEVKALKEIKPVEKQGLQED